MTMAFSAAQLRKEKRIAYFLIKKLYVRKYSAAKASCVDPQGRNSIESRPSTVTRTKTKKANNDKPGNYFEEPVIEATNPASKFYPSTSKSSRNLMQDKEKKVIRIPSSKRESEQELDKTQKRIEECFQKRPKPSFQKRPEPMGKTKYSATEENNRIIIKMFGNLPLVTTLEYNYPPKE